MRPANILHLGIKELRSLMRDPIMLVLIVYAFTISVYTAATAMPETLNKAPIAVVNEDRSPLSWRIVSAFYPPYFVTPEIIDHAEMDARMDAGLATFALDIPLNFQRDLLAGRQPTIQLNVDATRMSQAFTGSGYIHSIVLTGAALIREREHGTVEHLLVMPVTPFEIMTSKVWAMGLIVLAATATALTVVVQGWLSVPIQGSLALFLAGTALHLFATTSMGIFLGTVARSMPQFALLLLLVLLPLQMLSGASTPRESMPEAVQYIMLAAPNTHFVMLAQSILYRGAGLTAVWPQFVSLALIGTALFGFALARFRKTIETMG